MLADATVARNFAILSWTDHLVSLAGGTLLVAHGVMGQDPEEVGEIDRIRRAFEEESLRNPGSPQASAAVAALVGLDDLLARRGDDVTILVPTATELDLAVRLQDPAERDWRSTLGIRARRLDAGEAVSIAIATTRGFSFASDDDDGQVAYIALGGAAHYWTLDLVKWAVQKNMLPEADARTGYAMLCSRYRFWGEGWN